ncbi:MAG: hypothetical protein Q6373_001985 [Candidatus Sigynarchaeota archaeon]
MSEHDARWMMDGTGMRARLARVVLNGGRGEVGRAQVILNAPIFLDSSTGVPAARAW